VNELAATAVVERATENSAAGDAALLGGFALTLLLSAGLLFVVQPLFAKAMLPVLGGAPGVWNVCVLLFQASLLAGYAYAHGLVRWCSIRQQVIAHAALLVVAALAVPFALEPHASSVVTHPIGWLVLGFLSSVALPFFAVSSNAPLIQMWFRGTAHPAAADPYFLYSASNAGSLLGLLAYPLAIEPRFALPEQSRLWAVGFGGLVALTLGCGAVALVSRRAGTTVARYASAAAEGPPRVMQRLHWLALAAVPVGHMLAVTTYLTTDVGSVPLLWVVPLAVYLVTFVVAFAARQVLPYRWVARAAPVALLLLLPALLIPVGMSPAIGAGHLIAFGLAALMCHGELARRRPAAAHLTDFYLCVAAGGVLGGALNTLIAPALFDGVTEYPLVIVVACALTPVLGRRQAPQPRAYDLVLPIAVAAGGCGLVVVNRVAPMGGPALLTGFLALSIFSLSFRSHPLRLALAALALLVTGGAAGGDSGTLLHQERTFFGVYRVSLDPVSGVRLLRHGTTLHGAQATDAALRRVPMTYFHRSGPVGDVMRILLHDRGPSRVGVIGLGAGTLAAYAREGDEFTFYEIDPAVGRIASNGALFTYLQDCRGRCKVILGDARLTLAHAPSGELDLLLLDAFSSDAIPVHLLTVEALELYLQKLTPAGVVALHISNRHLALEGVVSRLAAHLGLDAHVRFDRDGSVDVAAGGKQSSHWVALGRRGAAPIGAVGRRPGWRPLTPQPGTPLWRDRFSDIVGVIRWK
jgi:hypothetical protein